MMPSATIARYVGGMFATRVAAVLVLLVAILLVLDLLSESGRILSVPGNSGADVWVYAGLRLPQLIAQFLPFSVLLASLFTLGQLSANGEVVIFKAAGISAHQILMPLFLVGFGVAAISFAFNETVLTQSNARLIGWKNADYAPLARLEASAPREVWARERFDLVHADRLDGSGPGAVLTDVVLYTRADDTRLTAITQARRAVWALGGWRLEGVRRFDVARGRASNAPTLFWRTSAGPSRFFARRTEPDAIPLWKLPAVIAAERADGKSVGALESALQHKLAGPLSAVLMPLLGAVAAFGLARSGKLFVRAVAGMFLGFAFFVADNFMLAMGQFNAVPPWVAAWSPVLLFFLIGESVLVRSEE